MQKSSKDQLVQNLLTPASHWLDAKTFLKHFSIITYKVPMERLKKFIPHDYFEVEAFEVEGKQYGLLSVVPFLDVDFSLYRLLPWLKFKFGQTNHRVYVINKKTGKRGVWFFGTTLGSLLVTIPQFLWKLPWHYSKYQIDCEFDSSKNKYERYLMKVKSSWCETEIDIFDTGTEVATLDGFQSLDDIKLILTHPVDGYFYRRDGELGTYSIWHPEMR